MDDEILIEEYILSGRVKNEIYRQIIDIEKNMRKASVILIHPAALQLLKIQDPFFDLKIFGLLIVSDESVNIEKMVEVRGVY